MSQSRSFSWPGKKVSFQTFFYLYYWGKKVLCSAILIFHLMYLCICTGVIAKAAITGHQGVLQTIRCNRKSHDVVGSYMTNVLMALLTNVLIPSRPRASLSPAHLQQWIVQIISLWHEAFLPASSPWSLNISFCRNCSTQSCSLPCCEQDLFSWRFLRWFGSGWGARSKGVTIL